MSISYQATNKVCATCAFWTGSRECDRSGKRVTVSSAAEKGKCADPKGSMKGITKSAGAMSHCWQKWSVMK